MTALSTEDLATLRTVSFLACVDDEALRVFASRARRARWTRGQRMVHELEAGAEVFVLLEGEAEASLEGRNGEREVLAKLAAGSAFGEMSSLTGELRSATVVALGDVVALVVPDEAFDDLRERRPEVAVSLVRTLAERLAGAERATRALLALDVPVGRGAPGAPLPTTARRGSVGRAWREFVVGQKKDLAVLMLAAFVATLALVRVGVFLSFRFDFAPRDVLRAAYMTGFGLLGVSACAAIVTFRPAFRRAIAVAYGIAAALILNELGVTLAFDIFYKNIDTPDPAVPFDVERLYRRTEGVRAALVASAVLIQAAYLRPFWRRVAFILRTRARGATVRVARAIRPS